MRMSILGSAALLSALLTLVATNAVAGAPSGTARSKHASAAAKRAAARAPVVAQPAAPIEALPALPPPPSAPAVSTTTTSSASVVTTAPAAEAPAAPPVTEVSPNGFVVGLGTGIVVPATPFMAGDAHLGPGIALDVRAGYYFGRHVGLVGGLRGSFGHKVGDCPLDTCHGSSFQFPVMLELAANNRARGFYGEAGFGLLTAYSAKAGDTTMTLWSPADLKLGAGYRVGGTGKSALDRSLAADFKLGVDIGRMTSATLKSGASSSSGSIEDPTFHVVVALGVGGSFAL